MNPPNNTASLGCGSLILIAIIVAIFSNARDDKKLEEIQAKLIQIELKLDRISAK